MPFTKIDGATYRDEFSGISCVFCTFFFGFDNFKLYEIQFEYDHEYYSYYGMNYCGKENEATLSPHQAKDLDIDGSLKYFRLDKVSVNFNAVVNLKKNCSTKNSHFLFFFPIFQTFEQIKKFFCIDLNNHEKYFDN